jgi:S-DNA-T family DNA segregation ATPase FtsK/SpoIIIE
MARRTVKKSKARQSSKPKAKTKPKPQEHLLSGVSPQRRVDIVAIILLLMGTLTLISLFTQSSGSVTGWWVKNLAMLMGWGVYVLPLAMLIIGAWLLFRNLEHLPKLSAERTVGIVLFFLNMTAWFHLAIDGSFSDAQMGIGGGYLGAAIKIGFVRMLGNPGAIVALTAWLLICLILTLDLTMANIVKWLGALLKGLGSKVNQGFTRMQTRLREHRKARSQPAQAENPIEEKTGLKQTHPAPPANATASGIDQAYQEPTPQEPVWVLPDPNEILDPAIEPPDDTENDRHRARVIEETLRSFGAPAHVVEIRRGPTVTLFGVEPDFVASRNGKTRVRVSKIAALADDLALALAAARIRIQAPVPGKGFIGIEVPNRQISLVSLHEILFSPAYQQLKSPLKIALGKDVSGNPVAADLTAMPHLLIAGTTGAGKSVCINDILACFLLNKTPEELRLILVDPKRVELTGYNGIPHLLSPVIVEAEHVVGALQWMMREMDNRYRKFSETGTRNIADFNLYSEKNQTKKLPYLLVVIDELSDLMMLAPDETERAITRLAQLARATGIHLIIATQRPSTDILTGLIKANFPARIAFAVASSVDSRVILDQPGAERLLGRGDMLFQAPDAPAPVRIQSAFVSDAEINRLAAYWRGFSVSGQAPERPDQPAAFHSTSGVAFKQEPLWEEVEQGQDEKFTEALEIVRAEGQASISMLQRKLRIGYTRAARLIDKMEEKGIISPPDPKSQVRAILDSGQDE